MTKFAIGDRVRVCNRKVRISLSQESMMKTTYTDGEPHEEHEHFETRIIGKNEVNEMANAAGRGNELWNIMTPFRRADGTGNPCHAEWSYYEDAFTKLEGPGWEKDSAYKQGGTVKILWESHGDLHFKDGTVLDARLDYPHIEPGDWYVSFEVPDGWRFSMAVNEKDFIK